MKLSISRYCSKVTDYRKIFKYRFCGIFFDTCGHRESFEARNPSRGFFVADIVFSRIQILCRLIGTEFTSQDNSPRMTENTIWLH